MGYPLDISEVTIDGESMALEEVVAAARGKVPLSLSAEARKRTRLCRQVIEVLVETRQVAYGVTTGFGAFRDIIIPADKVRKLQENLILSHACGVGDPFPEDVVRAAMILRANTLAKGHSGVRPVVIERLIEVINRGIYPYVPEKGSLGASGDLAPLAHLTLVLMGNPSGRFLPPESKKRENLSREDFLPSSAANLAPYGIEPIELKAKEGLALINGTQFITALACLITYDGRRLLDVAKAGLALSLEAGKGVLDALDPRLYEARPQPFHQETARELRNLLSDSQILYHPVNSAYVSRVVKKLRLLQSWVADLPLSRESLNSLSGEVNSILKEFEDFLEEASQKLEAGDESALKRSYREKKSLFVEPVAELTEKLKDLHRFFIESNLGEASLKVEQALSEILSDLALALSTYPPVQDDYSFRCGIQVIAAGEHALNHVAEITAKEINSANDNPLIFPPESQAFLGQPREYRAFLKDNLALLDKAVVSGGNFHGVPLAVPLDYLSCALSELASVSERRIAHLIDSSLNNGLPPFLAEEPGLQSGYMIPQYTAAALVSENKTLSHPASVDTIPTSANREDYVSMGTWGARKCRQVLENALMVLTIEILTAAQGVEFRRPFGPSSFVREVLDRLDQVGWKPLGKEDRSLTEEIEEVAALVFAEELLPSLEDWKLKE